MNSKNTKCYIIFNQSISSERHGWPQLDPAAVRLYGRVFLFLNELEEPAFQRRADHLFAMGPQRDTLRVAPGGPRIVLTSSVRKLVAPSMRRSTGREIRPAVTATPALSWTRSRRPFAVPDRGILQKS